MTAVLVAEDGTGDPEANSYVETVWANTYHENRGNEYWAALSNNARETCLIRATDYIDKRFAKRWRGFRMQKDQALAWPRLSAFDDDEFSLDGVPATLQKACAEYALRAAIYNVLAPDAIRVAPAQDMSDTDSPNSDSSTTNVGPVRSIKKVVGPIEKTVTYDGLNAAAQNTSSNSRITQSNLVTDFYVPQYPEADLLIEPLLELGGSVTLERA